ncbi:hypothetical protein QZH41_016202 [Actinostola sp. cb2023]|nr:hypothetical protein QZH41_016202 [Actinostola sp. cb2023]
MSAVIGIGDIHLSRNEFQKAIDYYEKGHTIAVDIKDKRNEAICYSKLGGAYSQWWIDCRLKRNDKVLEEEYLLKSIELYKDCLRCYEWLYNNIQDDEFKISIFDDTFIRIYRTLTKHLLQRNDWVTEALLVSERGRARALECLLVTKYSINQDNTSARNDPISYNAVEQMASRLCIVFYMLDANSRFQCTWVVEPKNAFEHWQSIDEAALKGIVESAFGLKVRGVQCEDRVIHTVEHQEKPDEVVASESSPSLPESIQQRIVLEEEELYDDDYARPLEYLYKALISPVLHKLTKDEIVIIPDGPLFNVPFAALQDPDTGSFLSETKCIRLAPSLTLLKALQESPADFHSKTGALIIGNPQVGEVMFRGKKRVISGLPCAEKEAQMIGELLGVKPFIGLQATKEAIKQNLREGVAIIHFAAHGTTNGEIFLTKSTTGSLPNEQDYILTMKDVQESGVRPQLVVLSCCHSGRGDVKAEGVVGMSRAFLAAGARAVVASLWAIADEATMVFMEKFYKHLQEGESASRVSIKVTFKEKCCSAYRGTNKSGNIYVTYMEDTMAYQTFIRACVVYAAKGCLNLDNSQLIDFYKECLVMAEHLKDINTEQYIYSKMAIAYQNAGNFQEAIRSCEKQLDIAREYRDDRVERYAYKLLAYIYTTSKRFQEAIECHKKYLQIVERLQETKEMKATYYDLVSANYHIGNYQEAIEYCKKVSKLVLETGDKEAESNMYDMLGICYVKLNDYDKAFHYYEMCLDICKEIPDKRKELGRMNRKLGTTLCSLERYEESLPYSRKALEIAMETHDEECQAAAYSDLGLYHQYKTEDFDKAVEYHNKSLTLSQKLVDKHGEGVAYGNLGNIYRSQCKYEKAIKFHNKQLEIAQEIGDTKIESNGYRGLGIVYQCQGEYSEAMKCYEEDLRICKDAEDEKEKAMSYLNLGIIYGLLGKKREAIVIYQKTLSLAEEMGHKQIKCKAYHNLGIAYYELSQLTESEEMLMIALAHYKAVGSKRGECDIYRMLGCIYRSQGDYNKAMEFQKRSFKISEEMKDPQAIMSAVIGIGDVHLSRDEFQKAIDYYEKGHTIAVDIKDKRNEATCYSKLGGAYSQWRIDCVLKNDKVLEEKYLLKSIEFNKDCLRCYEWLYNNIQDDEFKISIFDDTFIRIYRNLSMDLVQRNDWVTEALLVSERGRARALEDLLVTKYSINQDNTSAKNDPISYNAVEQMASRLCIVFYMLDANSRFQCTWVVEPKNPFEHYQLIDEATLKGIVESAFGLKVREVQCEDRLIHTVEHQEKPDEVDESTKSRCVLEEDLYDDDYARPLECLYTALISPVLHKLTKDEIVIIPDGPLFNVPFAALQDPDTGSFLSETKRIRLAPSLTLLKALQESSADFHSKAGALIIGNPQVGEVMFRGKKREIPGLPCAEKEAQMIGELLGVKPFIGPQATKEAIKQNLREGVAIIHFAAHGTTHGEIFLTPSTTGSLPNEQDYILTMKDVQESGVRPQLVVLSCCHSGRGDVKAEGVVGMSRAFLAAGARAVVASRWAIADEATMVFMEKFYKHLKKGESASKSLQQAMKDMRGIPRYN